MAIQNAPDSEPTGNVKKTETRRPLLLVLLLVIIAAGYVYFFTGLLKPEEEAAAPKPEPVTQVKKPLPPRPSDKGAAENKAKPKAAQAEEAVEEKPAATKEPAKPAPAKVAKPEAAQKKEVPPAAKAPAKKAQAEKVAKAEQPAGEEEKPAEKAGKAPAAAPAAKAKEAAGAAKGPVKKAEPAAAAQKVPAKSAEKKAQPAGKEAAKTGGKGHYALLIGEFVPDKSFQALQAKVGKLYPPVGKKTVQSVKPMNRLYVGEFPNYEAAAAELDKLRQLTRDAFSIEKGGKYLIYAGSYYGSELAANEKKRLTAKGVNVEMQKVEIGVSVVRLTAGRFASKEDAQKAVARLAKQGITATVAEAASP